MNGGIKAWNEEHGEYKLASVIGRRGVPKKNGKGARKMT